MTSTSEPKAFQICLKILEFEHENTSNSLQLMLQEMNQLPKILHELNDIDLFKV